MISLEQIRQAIFTAISEKTEIQPIADPPEEISEGNGPYAVITITSATKQVIAGGKVFKQVIQVEMMYLHGASTTSPQYYQGFDALEQAVLPSLLLEGIPVAVESTECKIDREKGTGVLTFSMEFMDGEPDEQGDSMGEVQIIAR